MFIDSIHTSVDSSTRNISAFKLLPGGAAPEFVTFNKKQSSLWAYADTLNADTKTMQILRASIDSNLRVSSSMALDESIYIRQSNLRALD